MPNPRSLPVLAALLAASLAWPAAAQQASSPPAAPAAAIAAQPGRLPVTARPQAYQVHLIPDLARNVFRGSEAITLQVDRPTNVFVLHALELTATNVRLDGSMRPTSVTPDAQAQTLTLRFAQTVLPGTHRLELDFAGKINTLPRGLYAMPYKDQGQAKVMMATELEPSDARRIFPLWDEPGYRASFTLSVDVPKGQTAVSNMPQRAAAAAAGGRTRVTFAPSPKMPSYLLVLAMGELETIGRKIAGVDVRVVATRGKAKNGRYALDVVSRVLPYYNEYFGTPYPLPKLDLIARPGGFGGAMENWGGITFIEHRLLYDPATSSQAEKEDLFAIIAHELAHQWFGNLVTMKWWDDLWLNEGFATWMEVKAAEKMHPEWHTWLAGRGAKDRTMGEDARLTTHPIQQPIVNSSDAESAFDNITYGKGMEFVRMLEGYLGPDAFRAGIRLYMKRHAYGNTATTDLWSALEAASKQPVRRIASAWVTRPGFPLVGVGLSCDDQDKRIIFSQRRFMADGSDAPAEPWPVPVVYAVGDQTRTHLLDAPRAELAVPRCDVPVVANQGDAGFYRVQYAPELFARLRANLATLPDADRLGLLADTWALAQAKRVDAEAYLSLADALAPDADPMAWQQVLAALDKGLAYQRGEAGRKGFEAAVRRRLSPVYDRLGWAPKRNEPTAVTNLRPDLLAMLARARDPRVMAEARTRWNAFRRKPASLSADLRPVVLGTVGRYGGTADVDALIALGKAAEGVEDRMDFFFAAAETEDPALARRVLALTLGQDLDPTLRISLVRRVGYEHPQLAREFLQRNATVLLEGRPPQDRAEAITGAYRGFYDAAAAAELEAYGKEAVPEEAWDEIRKEATRIRLDAATKAHLLPALDAWARNP